MNKEHKKNLIIRGTLRTTATLGVVAGLSYINPILSLLSVVAGYGWVLGSLQATSRKIEETERIDNQSYSVSYSDRPKANLMEKIENKLIDSIDLDKTGRNIKSYFQNCVNSFQNRKKHKLALDNEKNLLKHASNENQEISKDK